MNPKRRPQTTVTIKSHRKEISKLSTNKNEKKIKKKKVENQKKYCEVYKCLQTQPSYTIACSFRMCPSLITGVTLSKNILKYSCTMSPTLANSIRRS